MVLFTGNMFSFLALYINVSFYKPDYTCWKLSQSIKKTDILTEDIKQQVTLSKYINDIISIKYILHIIIDKLISSCL